MRVALSIVLCGYIILLAGCANNERVYGNIYEGLKAREAIIHPSLEKKPAQKSSISYEEYEAEREKLLEKQ